MKYLTLILPMAALFTTSLAQSLPSCAWNDCLGSWDSSSCDKSSGWDCICSNATAISQINTCVATSCGNATDQEAIFGAIAQLCANNGVTVTNSQEATFSATSDGSLAASITAGAGYGPGGRWNSGSWSSFVSACSSAGGSAPSGWGPGSSWGGHGGHWGSGHGPWGTKASGIACDPVASWTTWTAGWGPFSSWTGTWSGCSTTTATPSPATVTTTISGSVITGTTFGVQAAAESTGSGSGSGSGNAAASNFSTSKVFGISGSIAAAIFALMIAL